MPVRDYELSPAADGDICDIYDYSLTNFGGLKLRTISAIWNRYF